jgi:uncharacterized protein YacL (UPF0231 family)
MGDTNLTRDRLIQRRNEIEAELAKVNNDQRIELDPNGEEQAIQVEQDEVAVMRENRLREELSEIERSLEEIG